MSELHPTHVSRLGWLKVCRVCRRCACCPRGGGELPCPQFVPAEPRRSEALPFPVTEWVELGEGESVPPHVPYATATAQSLARGPMQQVTYLPMGSFNGSSVTRHAPYRERRIWVQREHEHLICGE